MLKITFSQHHAVARYRIWRCPNCSSAWGTRLLFMDFDRPFETGLGKSVITVEKKPKWRWRITPCQRPNEPTGEAAPLRKDAALWMLGPAIALDKLRSQTVQSADDGVISNVGILPPMLRIARPDNYAIAIGWLP